MRQFAPSTISNCGQEGPRFLFFYRSDRTAQYPQPEQLESLGFILCLSVQTRCQRCGVFLEYGTIHQEQRLGGYRGSNSVSSKFRRVREIKHIA